MNATTGVRLIASLIDAGMTLIVLVATGRALFSLARGHLIEAARLTLADGVGGALSFAVAATLLRMIVLQTWLDVAAFAMTYAIRTLVKRLFTWESIALRRTIAAQSPSDRTR